MDKNLIKFSGIYNDPARCEENNYFCEISINLKEEQIFIKECALRDNIPEFINEVHKYSKDIIIKNTLNIIKNIQDEEQFFEGEKSVYLNNLAHFLFKYIYCEIYDAGNLDFEIVKIY